MRAYKGVLKEKAALEETLKALSVQPQGEEEDGEGEGEEREKEMVADGREGERTEEVRKEGANGSTKRGGYNNP